MSALAPVLTRALTGQTAVSEHETDRRIMDAVVAELQVTPLRKLSLEDVARRAGVTRMTVYRRLGDRDRLIEATMARELQEFLATVAAAVDLEADPAERIASTFATGLTLLLGHPLIRHWLAHEPAAVLTTALSDDGAVLATASPFIAAGLDSVAPPSVDAARLGELVARVGLALLVMPPTGTDLQDFQQARTLAHELIVPLVLGATT